MTAWHLNWLLYTCRVNGRVGRCLYWCHFPMVASIWSSVQLPFIYFNLFAILVHSSQFSCRSQVSNHIFACYFITRTRASKLAKRNLPSRFRQVFSIVSRRTRRPIRMTLVPTPIKPGSVTAVASSASRVYYCLGLSHTSSISLLGLHDRLC